MTVTRKLTALAAGLTLAYAAHAFAADIPAPANKPYPGTIVLNVDATDVGQAIFRVRSTIPAKPGAMTLLYPQWVPGQHGPTGPLLQLAGLRITANGQPVEWTRDPVNVYAFHITVPKGAAQIEAQYEYLSPVTGAQGRITMTPDILGVQWLAMSLYPAGYYTRQIPVQANLTLPQGWQYGTALETASREGDVVHFKPTDLETLVDSPLFAGRYFKQYDLDPGGKVPVRLNVVGDTAEAIEAKPEQLKLHQALVTQAYKLFDSYHYKHYDFLFALSEDFGGIGREHHQSSENGVMPGYFTEWAKGESGRDLLPHEYTHSWNGKFRRPAGQNVPTFNQPLQNELLWVYEGQTQYWGEVLSARSGLISAAASRDALAAAAARYDNLPGRRWRAMQDTVNDPIIVQRRAIGWGDWQRSEDYYVEGQLIWLDVDTKIRELSGGKRSLDDFAKAFYSVENGQIGPAYYTFDDVVKYLRQVQEFDWASFLRTRVTGHGPGAPLDGLARAGYKLVYTETPTDYLKGAEERNKYADFTYSLGFSVRADGTIGGIAWDGLGFKAGLAATSTLVAVNNKAYKPDVLKSAIKAAKTGKDPIELLVKTGSTYRTIKLDYHDGLRYPRLERIADKPDLLEKIFAPK
ncbi:M61 family peptidase [Massilia arenosa]|uniref:M61 family peptidase n=1 Tax=Zemynaea arenosa TaxID=2561931 RepID=A0A4Y9S8V4_9BURK|nr:M61 family metallopeptidase [Massilia arenosa]TFW16927.1 M61 family peptidase [Massilia arenosa]